MDNEAASPRAAGQTSRLAPPLTLPPFGLSSWSPMCALSLSLALLRLQFVVKGQMKERGGGND